MTLPAYAALLQLSEGRLIATGRWPVAGEAREWARTLVAAGVPARLVGVVPFVEDPSEAAAALLAAVDR